MTEAAGHPRPGEMLGHYEVQERLAIGGMGEIYAARDVRLDRRVALKVLTSDAIAGANRLERFRTEARAVAALNHPNIVIIHDVEEDGGTHFIAMELVDGRTLGELIPAGGMPLREFFRIALQLTEAVAAAHRSGITHRDLKPDNVMVSTTGQVKVLDFGLAKHGDAPDASSAATESPSTPARKASSRLTEDGRLLGTVPYMSPEHVSRRGIDHRSDVFSLGIILYEMLTGERPFTGTSLGEVMAAIRDVPARPLREERPDAPRSLELALELALEKDPEERMQRASALHEQLRIAHREIISSPSGNEEAVPPPASRTRGATKRLQAFAGRHRLPLLLLAGVALVNYVETAIEAALRERYGLGVDLGYQLARAAHWFEGGTRAEAYGVAEMEPIYGYSFAYFFVILGMTLAVAWGLMRRPEKEPFRVFAFAIAAAYAISLPFFLFFPVPERWAYPDSGAILLSDLWAPQLIEVFRPFSGIDNCFPSFHVSLTVVVVTLAFFYRMRFRWSALWLGLLVILSTSVLGIHWLTDILAGLATGLLAVTVARRVEAARRGGGPATAARP